jgi:WXG100 family type VII secretion target
MSGATYGSDGSITYNFGEISDVAQAIGNFEGAMDGSLDELYREFQKLFAADWQGQAGTACDEARTKWNQGATEIKQALGKVGGALHASAVDMNSMDAKIAAQIEG